MNTKIVNTNASKIFTEINKSKWEMKVAKLQSTDTTDCWRGRTEIGAVLQSWYEDPVAEPLS